MIYLLRLESKTTLQVATQVKSAGRRFRYRVHFVPRPASASALFRRVGAGRGFRVSARVLAARHGRRVAGAGRVVCAGHLRSDRSSLMYSARALLQLQEAVGVIANIQVKGDQSNKVLGMMLRMRLEAEEKQASEALDREMSGASASGDAAADEEGSDEDEQGVPGEGGAGGADTARADGLDGDLAFAMALQPLYPGEFEAWCSVATWPLLFLVLFVSSPTLPGIEQLQCTTWHHLFLSHVLSFRGMEHDCSHQICSVDCRLLYLLSSLLKAVAGRALLEWSRCSAHDHLSCPFVHGAALLVIFVLSTCLLAASGRARAERGGLVRARPRARAGGRGLFLRA